MTSGQLGPSDVQAQITRIGVYNLVNAEEEDIVTDEVTMEVLGCTVTDATDDQGNNAADELENETYEDGKVREGAPSTETQIGCLAIAFGSLERLR